MENEIKEKGYKRGEEIAKVLTKKGYKNVYPLYRSAVVVSYDSENKKLILDFYGDPRAEGKEINETTIDDMHTKIELQGNRYIPVIILLESKVIK